MVLSDDALVSDPVDPFVDCSFFPFTSSSLFPPRPNPNFDSHLKNMVAKNPDSLVNQARSILDDGMEPVVGDKTTATASEDQSEVTITVNDKNPRERRPGLGHKRAKFSVKPIPSQPDMSLVPDLDIAKLKDPVEFFAAFERMENAKKELLKLKGQPLEAIDLNRAALPPRRRKPGIYRKKAIFKPRPYSLTGVPDNDDMSSDEPYDHGIMSPPRANATPKTTAMKASPQMRVSDVKPTMSSQVSELDELLSYDYEGLDEDGVQNFLQEKLNIKIIDTGDPSLPVMPDVHRREYGSLIEALPSMKDSIFDANDNSKATSSKLLNFSYQFRKSSSNQVSPPLSKSPLASISMLNKHISRLTPLKDPFLTLDVDSSPEVVSYPKAQIRKQAEYNSNMIDSPETSRLPENDEAINEVVTSPPGLVRKSATPNIEFEDRLNDGHSDPVLTTKYCEFGRSPTGGDEDIGVDGENLPSVTVDNIAPTDDSENCLDKIRQTTQYSTSENLFEIRSPTDGAANNVGLTKATTEEDQIAADPESVGKEALSEGSPLEKAIVSGVDSEMGEPLNTQGILIEKPTKKKATSKSKHKEPEESTTLQENIHEETLNKGKKGKAELNAAVLEEPKNKGKSKRKEPEESAPLQQENICEETVNKGKKGKAKSNAVVLKEPKNKKWKVESPLALPSPVVRKLRRHSLYAAGSKWEGKRRQSTRIRMRPLEFWRGERFLYGRVHDSVVSVIGVKYASPTKDAEEPAVKVKSFVSDKYKDLVDLASYH